MKAILNASPLRLMLVILVAVGAGRAHAADEAPTVMILLDGSGSMWGRLGDDKRAKFDIARETISQTLPKISPEAKVGLGSFGHRRRGNCNDAQVIVPPAPNNTENISEPLRKMNATGKGPLVLGLLEAAEAIGKSKPSGIILLHDDVDNCGQDACSAAQAIAKANPQLKVYPIGIGLNREKLTAMSCVAKLTGGTQFNAQNAAGLSAALTEVVRLTNLAPGATPMSETNETAPAKSAVATPSGPPGLYLSATLSKDSQPLQSPVQWSISGSGDGADLIREANAPRLGEELPPGTYDVEAQLGLARVRQTIDVKADVPTPIRVNLNAGVLKMLARAAEAGAPMRTPIFTVTAAAKDESKLGRPLWIGRGPQAEIVLPEGEYDVDVRDGLAHYRQTVKIAPAMGTTFDAALGTGKLQLSVGDKANVDGVSYNIYVDDPYAPGGRREVARSAAQSPTFTLPAGTYHVIARTRGGEVREQIALGAGDTVSKALSLNLGEVKLAASIENTPLSPNTPLTYKVTRLGDKPHEVIRTVAANPSFELPAGRYRVEATAGTMNIKSGEDIALSPGQSQDVLLELQAGAVTLKANNQASIDSGGVFWAIKDADRQTVVRTTQTEPTLLLAPGRYVVELDTRRGRSRTAFDLKAGEERTVEIAQP